MTTKEINCPYCNKKTTAILNISEQSLTCKECKKTILVMEEGDKCFKCGNIKKKMELNNVLICDGCLK